jgi:hypothetical protein
MAPASPTHSNTSTVELGYRLTAPAPASTVIRMHLDLPTLEAGLDEIRKSPGDGGRVELIVRRPADDEREILAEARLDTVSGLVGDVWLAESADLEYQVTVMNVRSVALVAGDRERWPLAGDQLYVDLDLSGDNLPVGSRFSVGSAVLEVSPRPHRGCRKFAARFGADAMRFVNSPAGQRLNLRGINTRVVSSGLVRPGDPIRKLATSPPAQTVAPVAVTEAGG